ncbi:MAG: DUF342 domain-containing protein [Acetivibrio ethanolgignens]
MSVNLEENKSRVRVSETRTEAYLSLCSPEEGTEYRVSDLEEILEKNGVIAGVERKKLQRMIDEKQYFEEELVAETKPAEDGIPGRFEFLFNTEAERKPKILPDGSVDYSSISEVEIVTEGEEIVHYYPATKGEDGMDVYGNVITAKPGRELPTIKGKGFLLSEDKRIYTAAITGKITYQGGRLIITKLLEIDGDVTHATGSINFAGDVVIHGNVVTGMTVQASGNIIVNGYVEAAALHADKDIVLKNGMQGGGKGEVHCKGNLSGKFFEQTEIQAGGNVNANAILNCVIMAEGRVSVSGKLGVIVGGRTHAIRGISATTIGNMSEVKMELIVGVDSEVYTKIGALQERIKPLLEENMRIEKGIKKIDSILEKQEMPELQGKKLQLLRAKISRESEILTLKEEKEKYETWLADAQNAKLVVQKSIYRGSKLTINGIHRMIESENYNVTYCRRGGEIEFYANI